MGENKNDNNKHFNRNLKEQNKKIKNSDRKFRTNTISYEELEENGFQFYSNYDVYSEIEKKEREQQEWQNNDTQEYLKRIHIGIKNNLHKFTPYQQTIIKMRFKQNLSIAEIAKNLNVSRGTVQTLLSRIQAKLCQYFRF